MSEPVLQVSELSVSFETEDGVVHAVDGVSYELRRGETLGIVGESGSGKSVSSLAILGLLRMPNVLVRGSVKLAGKELLGASEAELRAIRGKRIAMVFQDPLSSLHPLKRIGTQLVEAVQLHERTSRARARARALEMMKLVGIPDAAARLDAHPHELSGGMRQRVMIAMALVNAPEVLFADEPTTALDVTVQAQILELVMRLQRELDTAVVMITHDLGVVAEMADEIAVMYAGRIVERAANETLLAQPQHPYTWGLLASIPELEGATRERLATISGLPPSLLALPGGCAFQPRCPYARPAHAESVPPLADPGDGHLVACHLPLAERRALWARRQAEALAEGMPA
jgi:peptide/nickel transport system ATP-binding protein